MEQYSSVDPNYVHVEGLPKAVCPRGNRSSILCLESRNGMSGLPMQEFMQGIALGINALIDILKINA